MLAMMMLPSLSYGQWTETSYSDPMKQETYQVYTLSGGLLNEDTDKLGHFYIGCRNGKVTKAGVTVQGLIFHPDNYAEFRLSWFSDVRVKYGNSKPKSESHKIPPDHSALLLGEDEVKKLLASGSAIIEFADGYRTIHYVKFDFPALPESAKNNCGL